MFVIEAWMTQKVAYGSLEAARENMEDQVLDSLVVEAIQRQAVQSLMRLIVILSRLSWRRALPAQPE